jgi:hypothetical protein
LPGPDAGVLTAYDAAVPEPGDKIARYVIEARLGYRRTWRAHAGLDSIGVYTRAK